MMLVLDFVGISRLKNNQVNKISVESMECLNEDPWKKEEKI